MSDTLQTKDTIKNNFLTGLKPTASQFNDWITTMVAEGGNSGSIAHAIQTNNSVATGTSGSFASGENATAFGNNGSFAQGKYAVSTGYAGSFAQGTAVTSTGSMGSFAQGKSVTASGNNGSFAQGLSTWASGGNGSFAIGSAATANNVGAVQFSTGINSLEYSLKVKDSPRLCGNGAPAILTNGDMWIDSNKVYIRSNGVTVDVGAGGVSYLVTDKTNDYQISTSDFGFGSILTMSNVATKTFTLPTLTASELGKPLTLVKKGSGQVTVQANVAAGQYIADSNVGGIIYDSIASETYATLVLIPVDTTHLVITGAMGTWITV